MSSNPPSFKDDLLLNIFDLNADILHDNNAVSTARMTSQVCRYWRSLMLGTPFLWAKLIDLDEISRKNDGNWRDELIRRSGDAPLWICAANAQIVKVYHEERSPYEIEMQDVFFKEFIANNWHRIEKLVISHNSAFELTRSMLCFPAPLLKHIVAAALPWDNCSAPLFADQAPMLRKIYLGNNSVDHRAPWLRHLQSMRLDGSYSLSNVLAILSATRHLQELNLVNITSGRIDTSLPVISLSFLQDLTYWVNTINAGIALLNHIEIPVSCALSIDLESFDNKIHAHQKSFIISAIDYFMRHAESFVKSHTITTIHLDYIPKNYISWGFQANSPVKPLLGFSVPLNGDFDTSILDLWLIKLLSMDLKSATNLAITAHGESILLFGSFLSHLPSVNTIAADLRTLWHLTELQNLVNGKAAGAPSIIFPMLNFVGLFYHRKVPQLNPDYIDAIVGKFLLSRSQAGLPITTLDMSLIQPLDAPPHLPAFQETKCVTVSYRLKGNESVICRETRGQST